MSSEPLLDIIPLIRRPQDGAIITQFDYPMCEHLGLIKMDFLGLRNLTVLDDTVKNIERNRGETVVVEDLALDDPATYALLAARRHPRRLPARRRPDAGAAAARCAPTSSPTSARSARSTGPGPMGMDSHNKYARRKTGREPIEPIHPELAEPLAEILERDLRPDRLPGARARHRPEGRRLLPRPGRPAAQGDGQEEARDPRRRVRAVRGRDVGQRLLHGRDQGAVGHPGAVLRLRLQQGPRRGVRAGVLLDGVPQGELPAGVHGGAPDLGQGRQGQDRRSTSTSAGG